MFWVVFKKLTQRPKSWSCNYFRRWCVRKWGLGIFQDRGAFKGWGISLSDPLIFHGRFLLFAHFIKKNSRQHFSIKIKTKHSHSHFTLTLQPTSSYYSLPFYNKELTKNIKNPSHSFILFIKLYNLRYILSNKKVIEFLGSGSGVYIL